MDRVLTERTLPSAWANGWKLKAGCTRSANWRPELILVRDRGGAAQVLVEADAEMEKLRGLQIGTALERQRPSRRRRARARRR